MYRNHNMMRNPRRPVPKPRGKSEGKKRVEEEWSEVDFEKLEPMHLDLDPALVEQIRSRDRLKQLTLRVGREQIEEAKRVATRTHRRYQSVLRQWLAEGASRARSARLKRTMAREG